MRAFKKCGENRKSCAKRLFGRIFICHKSKFSFEETVQKVINNGLDQGWYAPTISNHFEIEQIFGIDKPNKSVTVSMNLPRYAHQLIKQNKMLACILPIQISVYERNNKVYISWINIEELGDLVESSIAGITKQMAVLLMQLHNEIIIKKNKTIEYEK